MNLSGTSTSDPFNTILGKLEELSEQLKIEPNVEVKVENSKGEHYEFSFADLKKVMDTIKPELRKKNLVLWQTLEGQLGVRTTIVCKDSAQWISSVVSIPSVEQRNIQYYGSVFTYLRRYAISTLLGLVNDQDDDANQADGNKANIKTDGKPNLTYEVMSKMVQEIEKGNWKDVEKQVNKYHLADSQKASITSLINQKKSQTASNKLNAQANQNPHRKVNPSPMGGVKK